MNRVEGFKLLSQARRSEGLNEARRAALPEVDVEPFTLFAASDGYAARVAANSRGAVAVYAGVNRDKLDLFRDLRPHMFYAIPAALAESLLRGKLVKAETPEEMFFLEWLARRQKAFVHEGRLRRYQLVDCRLKSDLAKQLVHINNYKKDASQQAVNEVQVEASLEEEHA